MPLFKDLEALGARRDRMEMLLGTVEQNITALQNKAAEVKGALKELAAELGDPSDGVESVADRFKPEVVRDAG